MLIFLIHGVATQNAGYGDRFKKKVKELILDAKANRDTIEPVCNHFRRFCVRLIVLHKL